MPRRLALISFRLGVSSESLIPTHDSVLGNSSTVQHRRHQSIKVERPAKKSKARILFEERGKLSKGE